MIPIRKTIIPGLNSDETLKAIKTISEAGAEWFGYTLIRLNDTVEPVFVNWLETNFPNGKTMDTDRKIKK